MSKPLIAVVGRPNVGKSTLFNKIVGKRLSIVEDTPGVTRDRIYAEGEWRNKTFHIVDTGGIEPKTDDVILSQMRRQAQMAIDSADVILFVVDIRTGMTATDQDVASMLPRSGKPVVLCVNKCDSVGTPPELYEFYNLGIGDPYPVSSVHGHGVGDLLDACYAHLDFDKEDEYGDENIKVAERIYKYPQVKSLYLMSGAYDLAVTIEGKSMKEVALFVAQKLAPMDSIISTATHFVLKKYKEEGIVFEDDEKDTRQVITL